MLLLLDFDTKTCQGVLLPAILLCAIQLRIKVLRRGSFPIEEATTLSPLLFGGIAMNRPRLPPSIRRNPNVDVRYGDRPTRATSITPPRVVPALGTPPGDWVPGVERDTAAARAKAARAAAAALPYADGRRRNPPAAAAARVRPIVAPEPPRADSVAFIAAREKSLPPRREPSRGPQRELMVHPENPGWSYLQKMWVLSSEDVGPSRRVC